MYAQNDSGIRSRNADDCIYSPNSVGRGCFEPEVSNSADPYRRINIKVFQIVLQIQEIINRVPAQIERQQPVYLIDTLGKESPFHLEFVRPR